jgi:hypothetical protein
VDRACPSELTGAARPQEAKRYVVGQRVRVRADGQVGTVSNIKIEGATGLAEGERPGLRIQVPGRNLKFTELAQNSKAGPAV